MKGHGFTGRRLQKLCEEGLVRAPGKRVLLRALLEEEATDSDLVATEAGALHRVELDMRKAVAFRVHDVGPDVPTSWNLKRGDVVINVAISGERVDASDKTCPWVVAHYEDLVLVIDGSVVAEGTGPT